jgi:hypothetical protein
MELTKERQIENLNKVKTIAEEILKVMKQDIALKIKNEGDFDPSLVIGDLGAEVISDSVYLEQIVGRKYRAEGFVVGYSKLFPGVRYYKDGSGEPDSVEFMEKISTASQTTAAIELISLHFYLEVCNAADQWDENKMAEQFSNEYEILHLENETK